MTHGNEALAKDESQSSEMVAPDPQVMGVVKRMARGVAHDLNNLLGVMMGNLHLVKRAIPAEHDALRFLNAIQRAITEGSNLAKDLIALGGYENHREERLDVVDVITDLDETIRQRLGSNMRYECQLPDGPIELTLDGASFEQLLLLFAELAAEATESAGAFRIDHVDDGDPRWLTLALHDNGAPLGEEDLGRVFEPYCRPSGRGSRHGMILAKIWSVLQGLQGTVEVGNDATGGVRCVVRLPR